MEKKLEDLQEQLVACGDTLADLNRETTELRRRLTDLEKVVLNLSAKKK